MRKNWAENNNIHPREFGLNKVNNYIRLLGRDYRGYYVLAGI